jgi:hypothetical protein
VCWKTGTLTCSTPLACDELQKYCGVQRPMARHRAAPVSVSTTGRLSRASPVANFVPLASTLSTLPASHLLIYLEIIRNAIKIPWHE